ncbi:FkbM family methyltransferase [Sciscionella marina]|uniref:FkbM family methyltransferase n=1 Tax=Sciscionella marina TaxID=508770 RepID=UPI00036BE4F9|nr:FkbM family methyltransferase [Sciscionella marina]
MAEAARRTACTVVAANYLPAARVLAASYLATHPGDEFWITVIDAPAERDEYEAGARILGPAAFGIEAGEYLRMATAYSVTELATAVKPYLLRVLLERSTVAVFLDPDITVYAPMPELTELAIEHDLVLTPHVLDPMPRDGKEPGEGVIMGTGIFNLGFLACGPGAGPFLDFWAERLRTDAIAAPEEQLFTDQRWVDQVPALFRHTVLRDPGFNLAYWNAHERALEKGLDGAILVNGAPLRFFHFSGYRPERPWQLSYHCAREPRVVLSANPILRELCDSYGAALKANGYAETLEAIPYGFARLADGTPITSVMRRLFRGAWIEAERPDSARRTRTVEPVPPHAYDGTDAFAHWLAGPADRAQERSGLNRLLMSVWSGRADLRRAFPRPYAQDNAGFRYWCGQSGVAEFGLPSWALPAHSEPRTVAVDKRPGVNMLGYLTAVLGLGEMARLLHDAVAASGIPISSVVEEKAVSNRTAMARPDTEGAARYGVSLLCVNADQTQVMAEAHPEVFADRYRIGFWAWELEEFPEWLHPAFELVDEIWTVSEFCARAIRQHTTLPVKVFPAPVREIASVEPKTKEYTQFLFAFDFNSVGERKNPWGAVDAFRRAFGDRDDVRLVLKAINPDLHPIAAERLRMAVLGDERITLLERYLSPEDLQALYAESDAYVSLHRSEGFGLTVAQAMVMGIPVVATDYSSTTEFVDDKTGWPVPYSLVPVGKDCFPYHEDALWAQPDIRAAAEAMRRIVDDPAEAARRARAAREYMLREHSMTAAATWVGEQLHAAHAAWLAGREPVPEPEPIPDPLAPLDSASAALDWRAEPGTSARNPLAPAVRKAMLRLLDHYDVHQRAVLGELTSGGQETARRLLQRIEWLEATVDSLRAKADETGANTNRLTALTDELHTGYRELRAETPGNVVRIGNLERDLDELRTGFAGNAEEIGATFADINRQFAERDARSDNDEYQIAELNRRLTAADDAARLRHAPLPDGTEVVRCDAGDLLVPRDAVILPWLRYHRSWETAEAKLMAELMGEGAFLDIGAHVGYHSLALVRGRGAVRRIVAVEADPLNALLLRRNLAVNLPGEAANAVEVLELAAWDTEASVRIDRVEAENSGDIRVHTGEGGTRVSALRLDGQPSVLAGRVDVIKTDLQGRDHRAFAGLAGLVQRDRPHLVVEFSPEAIEELGDDPRTALHGYREAGYAAIPVTENGPETQAGDPEVLIARARASEPGLLTLWLRPN